MDIGLIGLGKMGGNMRTRLRNAGHTVVGYDRNPDVSDVASLEELVDALPAPQGGLGDGAGGRPDPRHGRRARRAARPRATSSSTAATPAGPTTSANAELLGREGHRLRRLRRLRRRLGPGERLRADVRRRPTDDIAKVQPVFDALKPEGEFGCGPRRATVGAGHFSKMVHNGIEYAIMQAYAEGWELLEKVDLVDNVTEVFRSWREGTVIRSWLLDLLVAALDDDPDLAEIRGLRRGLRRGPLDRRGRASTTPCRRPAITASLFARFVSRQDDCPGDEGGRRDAQPVRRPRRPHRAARPAATPPTGQSRRRVPRVRLAPLPARLPLLRRRRRRARARASTAFIGRNGQGKTNLVEAIDYLSRLASHRVATDAPLVRAGADQAVVRAAVVRDGRTAVLEIEINPGRANRARVNRSPLPRARELLGLVRTVVFSPEDLTLVKGDPHRAAPVPRRPAGAAHPPARRGPRRLRPGAPAAQLAAQDRRRRPGAGPPPRRRRSPPSAVWDAHLARDRRRAAGRAARAGRRRCGPTSARPTRPSPGARRATTPTSSTALLRAGRSRTDRDRASTEALLAELERRRERRARPRHLAWSARTATSCC